MILEDADGKECLRVLAGMQKRKAHWIIGRVLCDGLAGLATDARAGDGKALYVLASLLVQACEALSQFAQENPAMLRPIARKTIRWPLMRSLSRFNSDPDKTLREIELGAECSPVHCGEASKWKPDFAATCAVDLLAYLHENFVLRPPIHRGTADKWWRLAKSILLRSYPHPETVPEFLEIGIPKSRTSPGRKREHILSTIRARFIALTPRLTEAPPR